MQPNEPHTLYWHLSLEDGRTILVETRDLLDGDEIIYVDGALAQISWRDPVSMLDGVYREVECRREGMRPDRVVDHKAAVLRLADANDWPVKSIEAAP
jgi:hypothetical protein